MWAATDVGQGVDFRRPSAARAADGLVKGPPFASQFFRNTHTNRTWNSVLWPSTEQFHPSASPLSPKDFHCDVRRTIQMDQVRSDFLAAFFHLGSELFVDRLSENLPPLV